MSNLFVNVSWVHIEMSFGIVTHSEQLCSYNINTCHPDFFHVVHTNIQLNDSKKGEKINAEFQKYHV